MKLKLFSAAFLLIASIAQLCAFLICFDTEKAGYFFVRTTLIYTIVFGLISFGTWKWLLKKRKGYGLMCFSILFFLAACIPATYVFASAAKANKESKQIMLTIENSLMNPDAPSDAISLKPLDENSSLHELFQYVSILEKKNTLAYEQAIHETMMDDMLLPEILTDADKLEESKMKLNKFRQAILESEKGTKEIANCFTRWCEWNKEQNSPMIKVFLQSYESKKEHLRALNEEFYVVEIKLLDSIESLLNFMSALDNEAYSLEDEVIVFAQDSDYDKFIGLMEEIHAVALKEEEIVSTLQKRNESALEELRSLNA